MDMPGYAWTADSLFLALKMTNRICLQALYKLGGLDSSLLVPGRNLNEGQTDHGHQVDMAMTYLNGEGLAACLGM